MFREGCRVACTWLRGGGGPFLPQAPPDSSASRTIAPECGPRATTPSAGGFPHSSPSRSRLKRWQRVVCYIPEGRLLTAGEGGASGQRRGTGGLWDSREGTGEQACAGAPADPECSPGSVYQLLATLFFGWFKRPKQVSVFKVLEVQCHAQAGLLARVNWSSGRVCFSGSS